MSSFEEPAAPAATPSDIAAELQQRLAVLDGLADKPLAEHPDVYQQLHADLQATLAEIDSA